MVTTFTYKTSLVRIDARNLSYRGNRPTHKQTTNKHTQHKQTGPITIHCAAASAQCKNNTKQCLLMLSNVRLRYFHNQATAEATCRPSLFKRVGWRCSIVVRMVSAGELSLSCARLLAW